MTQHKRHIRHCFNRARQTYDQYSHPQQIIGQHLNHLILLHEITTTTIIDLGCGTGLVTTYLAKKCKYKSFYAVDIADKLLEIARVRLDKYQVQICADDFDNLQNDYPTFALIFANMSLQWSSDLSQTFITLRDKLIHNGHIAFSLPLTGTFHELPLDKRNSYYSLQALKELIYQCGYELISFNCENLIYFFQSSLAAAKTIKATGANYKFNKLKSLQKKTFITSLYPESEKPFSLTYHIGYFIARKK